MLARAIGEQPPEEYFLVGLFSVLDAMMDMPMQQVLSYLPLPTEVNEALLNHHGKTGAMLQALLSYEQGDWSGFIKLNIKSEVISRVYLDSVRWTTTLSKDIYSNS